ncbi:hypothetical protein FKM82_000018 [Ascaphus truei]
MRVLQCNHFTRDSMAKSGNKEQNPCRLFSCGIHQILYSRGYQAFNQSAARGAPAVHPSGNQGVKRYGVNMCILEERMKCGDMIERFKYI